MKNLFKKLLLLVMLFLTSEHVIAQMKVHIINVGQGSSTLVEFPCGAILIDAGGESNSEFNSNDALNNYLSDFFDNRPDMNHTLECLYITHPHIDHTRGVPDLLRPPYIIKNAVTDGLETGSGGPQQKKLHRTIQAAEATAATADDIGFEAVSIDEITVTGLTNSVIDPVNCSGTDPVIKILWGSVPVDPGWGNENGEPRAANPNNNSLVIKIEYGTSSMLITGDLEAVAIHDLLQKYTGTSMFDADVYICGHHGSKNGTTKELLDKVTPQIAVISMGDESRHTSWTAWNYGHPNKAILDTLQMKVTGTRTSLQIKAGTGKKTFVDYTVTKAIYATGWDDNVELVADASGHWTVPGSVAQPTFVNINIAAIGQLETLPGIGPVKAQAIIDYRIAHGNFSSLTDVDNVPGIGPATINLIRPYVTL